MKYFLENDEDGTEVATVISDEYRNSAGFGYVNVTDSGDGLIISIGGREPIFLDYAELYRVEACLKMLDDYTNSNLLNWWTIYKGEKI
jgi:hypothetical protein